MDKHAKFRIRDAHSYLSKKAQYSVSVALSCQPHWSRRSIEGAMDRADRLIDAALAAMPMPSDGAEWDNRRRPSAATREA